MSMQTSLTQWSGASLPVQVCTQFVDIVVGLVHDFMSGVWFEEFDYQQFKNINQTILVNNGDQSIDGFK
jgi:hypothetical protein